MNDRITQLLATIGDLAKGPAKNEKLASLWEAGTISLAYVEQDMTVKGTDLRELCCQAWRDGLVELTELSERWMVEGWEWDLIEGQKWEEVGSRISAVRLTEKGLRLAA